MYYLLLIFCLIISSCTPLTQEQKDNMAILSYGLMDYSNTLQQQQYYRDLQRQQTNWQMNQFAIEQQRNNLLQQQNFILQQYMNRR